MALRRPSGRSNQIPLRISAKKKKVKKEKKTINRMVRSGAHQKDEIYFAGRIKPAQRSFLAAEDENVGGGVGARKERKKAREKKKPLQSRFNSPRWKVNSLDVECGSAIFVLYVLHVFVQKFCGKKPRKSILVVADKWLNTYTNYNSFPGGINKLRK